MKQLPILLIIAVSFFYTANIKAQTIKPPKAKRVDSLVITHGDTIHDYYLWMRNKKSADFINYLFSENGYANYMMKKNWLLQKHLYDEMQTANDVDYTSDSTLKHGYWYYTKGFKGKDYPVFYRRKDTVGAKPQVLLDVNKLAEKGNFYALSFFGLSPKRKYLAYGVNTDGTDKFNIYIKNIDTDSLLKDKITRIGSFMWFNDTSFYYIREDKKTKLFNRIYHHYLGDTITKDSLIWYEKDKHFSISFSLSDSKKYFIINRSNFKTNETYYADTSNLKFKLFKPATPNKFYGIMHYKNDSVFYIYHNLDKENNSLSICDTGNIDKKYWKDILAFPDSLILKDVFIYRNYLVYLINHKSLNYIVIKNRTTNEEKIIKPEGENYVLEIDDNYGIDSLKFSYSKTTMIDPWEFHIYYLDTGKDSTLKQKPLHFKYNKNNYETHRLWAKSYDGTLVPVDVMYKKGLKRDGNNPVYLYAYASYGINTYPEFSHIAVMYANRGFIYAIAHPRGESLFGKQWHENGRLMHKKNTYHDFIAVAQMLIDSGYTSSKKLAINGGSAGGMLMTAVTTMRPDLFKCVVANVPFTSTLIGMKDTAWSNIIAHFDEFGNPFDPVQYKYLKSWSPYLHIKDTIYPDILVTSGYNDSRVPVWDPAKWVAKMRYHKKDTNLLLFRTAMEGGHQGLSGRTGAINDESFQMAFIMRSLGINEDYITIKGKVTDANGSALPFVNIYLKGTSTGTTSNFDGEFSIDINKDSTQTLVFQYVGFKKTEVPINLKTRTYDLQVKLKTEATMLSQVTVTADGKDPAYGIINQARKNRKKHLNQIKEMSVDVYVKGEDRLNEIPEKFPAFMKNWELPDSNDIGLLSLSESVSKLYLKYPDESKEIMIASKVAGTKNGYSWNSAFDVMMNFYKNIISVGYSDRGFVSPIASQAMIYYKYKLVDIISDNNKTIYKIQVIPRRKNDPSFQGYIYITDGDWSIYSVNLKVGKQNGVKFMDSLTVKQVYIALNDSVWQPFTTQYTSYFKLFGFGIHSTYVGTFSNYNLNPHFTKDFFGYETYRINKDANKKDTLYWETSRIVKLTEEEEKYYKKEDSLLARRSDPVYLDSLRKALNKYHFGDGIWSGYSYNYYNKAFSWSVSPLISPGNFYYNTVEGLVYTYDAGLMFYDKEKTEGTNLYYWYADHAFNYNFKYSITNNDFYGSLNYRFKFDLSAKIGVDVFNYATIDETMNAIYTLFVKENYAKMYKANFAKISKNFKIMRGLSLRAKLNYQRRYPMTNNCDFSFYNYYKNAPEKEFLSNNPLDPENDNPAFKTHDVFITKLFFTIRFKERYVTYPEEGKYYFSNSKLPKINIMYKRGFYTSDSRNGFDFAKLSFSGLLNFGMLGRSTYIGSFGGFLYADKNMEFIDYKHFVGNRTIFLKNLGDYEANVQFNSLNYFDYSTKEAYVSGKYEHHFNGWVVNKFPLLRKTKFQLLAGAASLYTTDKGLFSEIYFGVENIFNVIRIDAVAHYQNNKFQPVFRIGVDTWL